MPIILGFSVVIFTLNVLILTNILRFSVLSEIFGATLKHCAIIPKLFRRIILIFSYIFMVFVVSTLFSVMVFPTIPRCLCVLGFFAPLGNTFLAISMPAATFIELWVLLIVTLVTYSFSFVLASSLVLNDAIFHLAKILNLTIIININEYIYIYICIYIYI